MKNKLNIAIEAKPMKKAPGASVVDEIQFDSLIDIDDPNCATLEETPLLEKGISAVNHIAESITNAWQKGSKGKNGNGSFLSNLISAKIELVMNDEAESAPYAKKMNAQGEEVCAFPIAEEAEEAEAEQEGEAVPVAVEAEAVAEQDAGAVTEQVGEAVNVQEGEAVPVAVEAEAVVEQEAAKNVTAQGAEASAVPNAEQAALPALSVEERKRQISKARAAAGRKHKGNQYTRRKEKAQSAVDKSTAATECFVKTERTDVQEVAALKEASIAPSSAREVSPVLESLSAQEDVSAQIGTSVGTNIGTKVEQMGKEGSLSLPQEERSPITPKEEYPFLFSQENGLTAGSKAGEAAFGGSESNGSAFTSLPLASALTSEESSEHVEVACSERVEADCSERVESACSEHVEPACSERVERACSERVEAACIERVEAALPSSTKLDKTLATAAREHFLTFYKQHFDNDYYWSPKDAGQMKNLINKLRFTLRNNGMTESNENILNALDALLAGINNQWVLDNFTVAIIASKYNELVAQMNVNTSTNLNNIYATDNYTSFKQRGNGGHGSNVASLVAKLLRK